MTTTRIEAAFDRTVTVATHPSGGAQLRIDAPTTALATTALAANLTLDQRRQIAAALDPDRAEPQTAAPLSPKDCDPDAWYEVTYFGRRVAMKRDCAEPDYPWRLSAVQHVSDHAVSDPVLIVQVNPVEKLAAEIETATRAAIRGVVDALNPLVPTLTASDVESVLDPSIRDCARDLARHILGQEATSDE